MTIISELNKEIINYLIATGVSKTFLGEQAVNDRAFVHRVLGGKVSPRAETIDRIRQYMADNPPQKIEVAS